MSETKSERLKRLKRIAHNVRANGCQTTTLSIDSIDFLIEQADLAQVLEMKHENSGSIFSRQNQMDVMDENKRLREVLEDAQNQLITVRGKNERHDREITGLCVEIRQALEGVSDDENN